LVKIVPQGEVSEERREFGDGAIEVRAQEGEVFEEWWEEVNEWLIKAASNGEVGE
jgi:hypothetical protein